MLTPIVEPRPEVAAAFLRPGMELRRRSTGQLERVHRVERIRVKHEDGWLGPGSPHTEMRVRTGDALSVVVGGCCYRDVPSRTVPTIRDLVRDYELPPVLESKPSQHFCSSLVRMERDAGFSFYDKQFSLISRLATRSGAMPAVDTGGGKTLIGISLIHLLAPRRVLVLPPQGLMPQWLAQFNRFLPGAKVKRLTRADIRDSQIADGIWLSYHHEFLLNDGGLCSLLQPDAFDMVVIDEAHLLMNPETVMAQRLFATSPRLRFALTATPVPNRLTDPYPLCRWLLPGHGFRPPHQEEFIVHDDGRREPVEPVEPLSPALYAADLAPVVVAMRKQDLRPDLPPCTVRIVTHDMSPAQAKSYRHFTEEWTLPKGDAGTIARVRQSHLRNVCALGDTPKNRALANRISSLLSHGERVVVASARTAQSDWIEGAIHGELASRIDSTVPASQHATEADAFKRGDTDLLLIGLRCAYGYSFSDVAWMLVASPEWGLGTVLQSLGRVWRLDSQRPVTCEIHVAAGTIEEEVVRTVALKESAATAVLYGSPPLLDGVIQRL
jgi:hypothetical protein